MFQNYTKWKNVRMLTKYRELEHMIKAAVRIVLKNVFPFLSVADYRDIRVPTPRSGDAISARLYGMPAASADAQSDEFIKSVAVHGAIDDTGVNSAEPQHRRWQRRSCDFVVVRIVGTKQP